MNVLPGEMVKFTRMDQRKERITSYAVCRDDRNDKGTPPAQLRRPYCNTVQASHVWPTYALA